MYKFLLPLFALALLLVSCSAKTTDSTLPPTTPAETSFPGFDGKLLTGKHIVVLKTSKGDITIELDADKAPKTVTNFVVLAKSGYYDGLTFHRVIPNFMIQGGDPVGNGSGGKSIYGETFADEKNDFTMARGSIAMANRGPDTNGSQFFIYQGSEVIPLQGYYTIFGKVTKGMDVVDTIVNIPRNMKSEGTKMKDMPLTPVTFKVEVKS